LFISTCELIDLFSLLLLFACLLLSLIINRPWNGAGATFSMDVKIYSYQGLQSPVVYVSQNTIPTLEKFDWTNSTVDIGGGTEQSLLFQKTPADGMNFIHQPIPTVIMIPPDS
jgi:hypothetical protein